MSYALSWHRSTYWADLLDKPSGRAVSPYKMLRAEDVGRVAAHINSLDPQMRCGVERVSP